MQQYLGNRIYTAHELHTVKATYDIFGLGQPLEIDETEPVVIRTLTSTENETLDKLMETTQIGMEKTVALTTHDDAVKQNIQICNEATLNIKPALNLIPLVPDFMEDDSSELSTMPFTPNLAPIHDIVLAKNDQRDQEAQQISITTTHEDETKNVEHSMAIKKQEKGITVKRKINLRSKQPESEQQETVTTDITNTVSATVNSSDLCKQIHKADLAVMELETRFNIKPVKVVLKKLSDKQIHSTVKANTLSTIKKDTMAPRNATRQAKDIYTPSVLRKVTIGKTARFTFSTYRLPSKVRCKYKLKCTVARCGKVFTTVRHLNQHHILKHCTVKYRCRICMKCSSTQSQLRNHMYTHMDKKFQLWQM